MAEMGLPSWVQERLDLREKQIQERGKLVPGKERYGMTQEQKRMLEDYRKSNKVSPEDVENFARDMLKKRGR